MYVASDLRTQRGFLRPDERCEGAVRPLLENKQLLQQRIEGLHVDVQVLAVYRPPDLVARFRRDRRPGLVGF